MKLLPDSRTGQALTLVLPLVASIGLGVWNQVTQNDEARKAYETLSAETNAMKEHILTIELNLARLQGVEEGRQQVEDELAMDEIYAQLDALIAENDLLRKNKKRPRVSGVFGSEGSAPLPPKPTNGGSKPKKPKKPKKVNIFQQMPQYDLKKLAPLPDKLEKL